MLYKSLPASSCVTVVHSLASGLHAILYLVLSWLRDMYGGVWIRNLVAADFKVRTYQTSQFSSFQTSKLAVVRR